MLLEARDIAKEYDGNAVLKDVSFGLERGQSMAVVAPSGAGKSTLLSIAGLLLAPSSGSIVLDGTDTSTLSDDDKSRLRAGTVGMLFQHTQLIGSLRAFENVAIAADFASRETLARCGLAEGGAKALEQRASEMLCALGLEDRLMHYPFQLSVGQKRRIATARALFLRPSLIIADEPTNDLDAENTARVVEALFAPVERGEAALLYATHDAALAARADKTLRIARS